MKKDFWLERRERKETGFHQDEASPYLRQRWQKQHSSRQQGAFHGAAKTATCLWLRKQGSIQPI